mmetsp:Transcript_31872/g.93665  ORF Transcript_31872/g.93665 Transcript_31872/m.93665 type:complete len:114 (-) Transcript_31872:645-986(-)
MSFIPLRTSPIEEPAPPSCTKNLIGSSAEEAKGSSEEGGGCTAEEWGCLSDDCGEEEGWSDLGVGPDLRVGDLAFFFFDLVFAFVFPFFADVPESIGTGSKSGRGPLPLGDAT